MNFRDERQHDRFLIELVNELDRLGKLSLLGEAFGVPFPEGLERAERRQLFDVELTFANFSCVVETKVDSNESGGWGEPYQTEIIAREAGTREFLKEEKFFLFITYGTSEFYTKPYHNGPAAKEFRHVKLDDMVGLVEAALKLPLSSRDRFDEWLSSMKIEQRKRAARVELLKAFNVFRREYLSIHGDVDFPNNRFSFCAPELAFPVLHGLAQYWNSTPSLHNRFGRVSVYPVARMSPPIHDSILNFREMWDSGNPPVGRKIAGDQGDFYFEINEDFNHNLKLESETLPDSVRDQIWNMLAAVEWPEGIEGRCREYKQSTYVLFEWDFGLLGNIEDHAVAGENLFQILEKILKVIQ